jgi:hypothetical protein
MVTWPSAAMATFPLCRTQMTVVEWIMDTPSFHQ